MSRSSDSAASFADPEPSTSPLRIRNLTVRYGPGRPAVDGVNIQVDPGAVLGLIGESGSGKSTIAYAIGAHLPTAEVSGEIWVAGRDVASMSPRQLRSIRGRWVGFVHQDPRAMLNPGMRIGAQVAEQLALHTPLGRDQIRARVLELLTQMRLPEPSVVVDRFPHQLSGGQQQRVGIAMALSCQPDLLIMDEPTTGLDVTTEAHIMELLRDIRRDRSMAMLFISHNLALVASIADQVAVMRYGKVIETGPAQVVLSAPTHEYTRHLVAQVRRVTRQRELLPAAGARSAQQTAVRTVGLRKSFHSRRGRIDAVNGVDLFVRAGSTLAVVGESGSGKTSLARCIAGLVAADAGTVKIMEHNVRVDAAWRRSRDQRRLVQIVFQNPESSLNPRATVGQAIGRSLTLAGRTSRQEIRRSVLAMLDQVQLPAAFIDRLPAELSGGEKQRVAIARAFAMEPSVVLLDEPTSALDASVQSAVFDLLRQLQRERDVAYLLITHDFSAVRALADDIVVMRHGQVVERGATSELIEHPTHPYTQELLSATITLDDVLKARQAN